MNEFILQLFLGKTILQASHSELGLPHRSTKSVGYRTKVRKTLLFVTIGKPENWIPNMREHRNDRRTTKLLPEI